MLMLLSILICHLFERDTKLDRLLNRLLPQLGIPERPFALQPVITQGESAIGYFSNGEVEVLVLGDKGGMSIGRKRNALLTAARGEFACYIDDDDMVNPRYVERILAAIKLKPTIDVVGMEGVLKRDGFPDEPFYHSIQHKEWRSEDKRHYRPPNHLNPVRRELALKVMFPELNHGEDFDYSNRLLPLLKTEVVIEETIYEYLK